MTAAPQRLVVVGGGISGLAAAWAATREAERRGLALEVLLLEREAEVGGKALSLRRDGWLVEEGPTSFLPGDGTLQRLAESVGLAAETITADPVARRRYVVVDGAMRPLASSPFGLVRSGILGVRGAGRILLEPFIGPRRDAHDESVWEFVARRLGHEVADRIVLPAMLGIFAGDARTLSMEAAFPKFVRLEREHGSLVRGLLVGRRRDGARPAAGPFSFRNGMQQLPLALAQRGGFLVRRGSPVAGIERHGAHWRIATASGERLTADALILATDAKFAARALQGHAPDASRELDLIASPGIAVIALGYGPDTTTRVPQGFGALIARGEGYRMLGNLWESRIFAGRAPDGHLLMRVMVGGATDEAAVGLTEGELASLARAEVARLYGLSDAPVFEHVVRVPSAIPQYVAGHRARVERIDRALEHLPAFGITGFALRGVSFPDAAGDGIRVGVRIAAGLSAPAQA